MFLTKLKRTVAAVALTAALASGAAQATTFDIGAISTTPYINSAQVSVGSFLDTYNFSVTTPELASSSVTSLGLSFGPVNILNISNLSMSLYDSANALIGTASGTTQKELTQYLGTGSYHIDISGIGNGAAGGTYLFSIAAAVPEPEQWSMLFAGMLMLGAIARRRG